MRKVRTHRFKGVKYDIYTNLEGICDKPKNKKYVPSIAIAADIDTKLGLDALIHEALHAERWSKHEKEVSRTATEIADFLWRLGFRRPLT